MNLIIVNAPASLADRRRNPRPVDFALGLQFFPYVAPLISRFSQSFDNGTLDAIQQSGVSPMPLGEIRSRFIQMHLERALTTGDRSFAQRVACEFRRYFEWFAASIDEPDREFIASQLRKLEERTARGALVR